MATYKSTWQTKQEEKRTKLSVNPSATEVQRETRVATFTVTCTSANVADDLLILGSIGVAKHRILAGQVRVQYSGAAIDGTVNMILKRAAKATAITASTDEATLGTCAADGTVTAFTPSVAPQGEGLADDVYYIKVSSVASAPAAGVVFTFTVPYFFEGI